MANLRSIRGFSPDENFQKTANHSSIGNGGLVVDKEVKLGRDGNSKSVSGQLFDASKWFLLKSTAENLGLGLDQANLDIAKGDLPVIALEGDVTGVGLGEEGHSGELALGDAALKSSLPKTNSKYFAPLISCTRTYPAPSRSPAWTWFHWPAGLVASSGRLAVLGSTGGIIEDLHRASRSAAGRRPFALSVPGWNFRTRCCQGERVRGR